MHEAADAHKRSADIRTTIEAMRPTTNDLTGGQDTAPAQGWQNPREMAAMFDTSASYVRMVRQRTGADGLATAHVSSGTDQRSGLPRQQSQIVRDGVVPEGVVLRPAH